jgi:hypothetical protein
MQEALQVAGNELALQSRLRDERRGRAQMFAPFRPCVLVAYEHMFPQRTSTLGQRALGALGLMRSFLLLEDDCRVDWEVDQDERIEVDHPHRAPLRKRAATARRMRRRPGQTAPAPQVCISPVAHMAGGGHEARRRRRTEQPSL